MDEEAKAYFRAVEDHFIRRRGRALLLSPGDVRRVAEWHAAGIPLAIVLEGIDMHFDRMERRGKAPRRAVTLAFVEDEVHDAWVGARRRRLGRRPDGSVETPEAASMAAEHARFLEMLAAAAQALDAGGEAERAVAAALREAAGKLEKKADLFDASLPGHDPQRAEDALRRLERGIASAAREALGGGMAAVDLDVAAQLADKRSRMSESTYERVFKQLVEMRLRERFGIPRLSLFHA